MLECAERAEEVRGDASAVAVPCPRCGRAATWVLRDQGNFHAVEQLPADCDCDLTDDEWLDLGGVAHAQLGEERGQPAAGGWAAHPAALAGDRRVEGYAPG